MTSENQSLPPAKSPWFWGVPVLASAMAILLWVTQTNQALFILLNGAVGGEILWSHVTLLGDALVALVLLSPFVGRRPEILWSALLATLLAVLWVHGMKELLQVLRPAAVLEASEIVIIGPTHRLSAFPSGHSTTIFTLVGVVVVCLRQSSWAIGLLTLAALVALSRVMVGAHWPLDILGGAFGGWLAALGGVWLNQRMPWGRGRIVQGLIGLFLAVAAVWLFQFDTGYSLAMGFQRVLAGLCLGFSVWGLWRLIRQCKD
ncbi:MAG TPA: phosphatase PAP2 family protein [Acidiferrobacteraceae bacterium]|nr:phosphatase PAP2 family protein [Acidiferrobacteraceae bacterium]